MTVRRAARDEAAPLGDILADAFNDDPVFRWLIPEDVHNREHKLRTFFSSMSRAYLRQGKPCHLAGDNSAAAMWAEPGKWALPISEMTQEAEPQIAAFGDNLLNALELQTQIEKLHPRGQEHWYLGYLGTLQSHQGQGLGSQLLREVLDPADTEGIAAYLESSNERNLTLYERHGFKVVGELEVPGGGPSIWRMWRDPA